MQRTVNRLLIDEWVVKNGPDGLARLALKSKISTSYLSKIRLGRTPTNGYRRIALAKAIGTTEDKLFPLLKPMGEAS